MPRSTARARIRSASASLVRFPKFIVPRASLTFAAGSRGASQGASSGESAGIMAGRYTRQGAPRTATHSLVDLAKWATIPPAPVNIGHIFADRFELEHFAGAGGM